jgi:hypothetical protein
MCNACRIPAGKHGADIDRIKDVRRACKNGLSAKPVKPYLGKLTLNACLCRLQSHAGCDPVVMAASLLAAKLDSESAVAP